MSNEQNLGVFIYEANANHEQVMLVVVARDLKHAQEQIANRPEGIVVSGGVWREVNLRDDR